MAVFTLDDRELSNLLSNIILAGRAPVIEEWLKRIPDVPSDGALQNTRSQCDPNRKRLAYNGFHLSFRRWDVVEKTVTDAAMQLRRPSSLLGFIENRRILKFLKNVIMSTHDSVKLAQADTRISRTSEGFKLKYYSSARAIAPEFEIELIYEPKSEGQAPHRIGLGNDFIIIKFSRNL
jgi:hypothetical protein